MSRPKLSIVTPTHNPQYLDDAWRTLKTQSYKNWEWVLVPNGDSFFSLPAWTYEDERIRVIHGAPKTRHVGALKRFACEAAKGDAFLELDHDDFLAPGQTLEFVAQAIEDGADFVYTDDAAFGFNKQKNAIRPFAYKPSHGWWNYPVRLYGRQFAATRMFEPSARSLCEVYYAPDHLRCWTKEAYEKAGKHDPNLPVVDDADLMQRTYLSGAKFWHLEHCGYFYRQHESNTVYSREKEIVSLTRKFRRERLQALIEEECRRKQLPVLDMLEHVGGQAGADSGIEKMIANRDTFGCIKLNRMLHMIPRGELAIFMQACWSSLVPGGWIIADYPDMKSAASSLYVNVKPGAFPHLNTALFVPFCDKKHAWAWADPPGTRPRFQLVDAYSHYPEPDDYDYDFAYVRAFLCASKGQRQPGLKKI